MLTVPYRVRRRSACVPQVIQRALGVAYLSIYHREGGGRVVLYDMKQGKVRKRFGWRIWHHGRERQEAAELLARLQAGLMRSSLATCQLHAPVLVLA